ncbi:AAA family ATPase [Kitasatospora sp. NPDC050543]|uniref:AAA family ATPase n=1 Tax=Kitasatospora sp. NPDC050543 TaxID=3364054 RepID=UPI0037951CF9
MSGARERLTEEVVVERLARLAERSRIAPAPAPAERAYREAAAVLVCFSPETIHPAGGEPDQKALSALVAQCQPVHGPGGNREWRLPDAVRRATLAEMAGPDSYRAALEANPERTSGPVQQALDRYLTRSAPPVEEQDLTELLATARVVGWLAGLVPGLPSKERLAACTGRLQLLDSLRRVRSSHFGGRADILKELAAHLEGSGSHAGAPPGEPLVIWGPGGIGKSTVLAKFILDRVDGPGPPLPFVFIDLDRPGMLPQEPLSLIIEAVRQLRVQFPQMLPEAKALHSGWLSRAASPDFEVLGSRITDTTTSAHSAQDGITASVRLLTVPTQRAELYQEFADLLTRYLPPGPILLAIDTFELAQQQGPEVLAELWRLFGSLGQAVPALRIVLCGRVPVEQPARSLRLPDFDREAARGYLTALLGRRIAADAAGVDRVIDLVGGNPLSLRLAADLVRSRGAEGLAGIGRGSMQLHITADQLQGYLYRRVLDHIEDPDVRRLAHLGLVLRRLTPGVIRYVLAGRCDVAVPDDARAEELFELCAREVTLVTRAADGALEHRADVRRQLLPLLRADSPGQVAAVHRAAVGHYAGLRDLSSRTEELYHRLSLGESAAVLDERWEPGAEALLVPSIDELPPSAQAYLSARAGMTLSAAILDHVPQEEWERHAQVQVTRLMELGDLAGAVAVLDGHSAEGVSSRLLILAARVRAGIGEQAKARKLVGLAAQRAAQEGDRATFLEATYTDARWSFEQGQPERALTLLGLAAKLAVELGDKLMQIRVALARWELERSARPQSSGQQAAVIRHQLVKLVDEKSVELLSQDPAMLVSLTAALGDTRPELVWQSLRVIGLQVLAPEQSRSLAAALESWDRRLEGAAVALVATHAPTGSAPPTSDPDFWVRWLATTPPVLLANSLTALNAAFPGGARVAAALSHIYRQWLDAEKHTEKHDDTHRSR